MTDEIVIKAEGLTKRFGNFTATDHITFEVRKGEIFGFLGANGAGKTTAMRMLCGLSQPSDGKAMAAGYDVATQYEQVKRHIGYMSQKFALYDDLTVEENLEMGAFTQPNDSVNAAIEHVYERFPRLKERRKQVAGTLSGGEQQMLAMGRALMSRPKLMMLDEPSMGLAPILVDQIFDIVKELNQSGVTILLVEQNAQMALSIANRGYVLETGRIVLSSDADELLHNDAVKKAYLGG